MTRFKFRCAAAGLALACSISCLAQDRGNWYAASTAATRVTGDISIAAAKVTIDLFQFPLVPVRRLTPVEVSAAFDADVNAGINGDLYRVQVPARQRFQHKNTLCGTEETEWMATYVTGKTLQVTFFSGNEIPVFSFDALANSANRCGTFAYTR
jgi:hypothetical protein